MFKTIFKGLLLSGFVLAGWLAFAQEYTNGLIPSPPMNIGVVSGVPGLMVPGFRGTEKGISNFEEDCQPPRNGAGMAENSELYQTSTRGLGAEAKGKEYSGPPNITWSVSKEAEDGSETLVSTENTNRAVFQTTFPEPGIYKVENDGSRETDDGDGTDLGGGAGDGTGSGTADGGGGGAADGGKDLLPAPSDQDSWQGAGSGGNQGTPDGSGSAQGTGSNPSGREGSQIITSTNIMTVKAHDITAPNLFVLFQEGAGVVQLAKTESALASELDRQLKAIGGKVNSSEFTGELKDASLLAIVESPLDAPPEKKTAAIVKRGVLFDQGGRKLSEDSDKVKLEIADPETRTRLANIDSSTAPNTAVYVRRNVPFLVVARQSDNSAADPTAVTSRIQDKSGREVEMSEGAYLFRVPNFPREKFVDQPDYEFVMAGTDKVGNKTEVKIPLFVVNTQTSFEAGKAE